MDIVWNFGSWGHLCEAGKAGDVSNWYSANYLEPMIYLHTFGPMEPKKYYISNPYQARESGKGAEGKKGVNKKGVRSHFDLSFSPMFLFYTRSHNSSISLLAQCEAFWTFCGSRFSRMSNEWEPLPYLPLPVGLVDCLKNLLFVDGLYLLVAQIGHAHEIMRCHVLPMVKKRDRTTGAWT